MAKKINKKLDPKKWIDPKTGGVYWKDVLNEIYTQIPNVFGFGKEGWTDDNPLAERLNVPGQAVFLSVCFLIENDLVISKRSEGDVYSYLYLTKKGFDVALNNEKIKADSKLQKVVISLTAMIALTTMFTFLLSTGKYNSDLHKQLILYFFLIGIFCIAYYNKGAEFIAYIKKKL